MAAAPKRSSSRGRATRWTEQQVKLLRETVASSPTAREAFQKVAQELGKSPGTVQQKWYAMQRAAGKGRGRGPSPRKASAARHRATSGGRPGRSGSANAGVGDLRALPIDDLIELARDVKAEIDRRRRELDEASKLFG